MIENNNNQVIETETKKEEPKQQTKTDNQPSENNKKNNKKTLVIIISAIAALIIVIILIIVLIHISKKRPIDKEGPKEPTIEEKKEAEDIFSSDKVLNISGTLHTYAVEIYNSKKYIDFQKDPRGVHYASKYDLKLLGYDVSMIDESCIDESPIIYFDIDHILNDTYEFEPIVYMAFCPKQTK